MIFSKKLQFSKYFRIFLVKKERVIHIFTLNASGQKAFGVFFFVTKRCQLHISTVFAAGEKKLGFLYVKKVPIIHISTVPAAGEKKFGVFLCKKGASYTHFWNLIFSEKTKKKN